MASKSFVASHVSTNEVVKPHIQRFSFTGSGKEYFGIWIVNILLTIVTLGIYSAWAKVRNKQYFYGNTYLENASFEYTATPIQILKGRIIAVVLLLIYSYTTSYMPTVGAIVAIALFICSPWIIMKSLAFNAHYSRYRGINFTFHQSLIEAIKVFILYPVLAFLPAMLLFALTGFMGASQQDSQQVGLLAGVLILCALLAFFLAYPLILYLANRYVINNHSYGNADFKFRITNPKVYFKIYLKAAGLAIVAMILIMLFAIAVSSVVGISVSMSNAEEMQELLPVLILAYLVVGTAYAVIFAYIKARTYNVAYQNTLIGGHKLRANMSATDLATLYITNTIGIALTLGLFIPWAKVRSAKFRAKHTAIQVNGDLSSFIAKQSEYQNALGEEIGEVFDMDIAL